jgi:hypothetical protein
MSTVTKVKIIIILSFFPQSNMNEEPLVKMELVSSETDPLLFRYSRAPTGCTRVQVRKAACFVM